MPYCPNCGSEHLDTVTFCPDCGTRQVGETAVDSGGSSSRRTRRIVIPVVIMIALGIVIAGGLLFAGQGTNETDSTAASTATATRTRAPTKRPTLAPANTPLAFTQEDAVATVQCLLVARSRGYDLSIFGGLAQVFLDDEDVTPAEGHFLFGDMSSIDKVAIPSG